MSKLYPKIKKKFKYCSICKNKYPIEEGDTEFWEYCPLDGNKLKRVK